MRVFGCEPNATSDEEYSNFAAEIVILPPQMRFTQQSSYVKIFCCLVLFLVAVMGNFTALVNLSRRKHQRSVVSLMMGHLAAADLLVTFFMIPLEGGFHLIVQWLDGNLACKFFLFLRAFALYLSSNVLVCVSLDRYSAILHPLKNYDARRRGKMMLCGAWICSFFYALPQVFVTRLIREIYSAPLMKLSFRI
ncbi:adipokinetic hormone/corazonin-related peptide receptor variant I-like [Neodiprion lecontei]|uniref:Adipokinetic hormone/corazonin-related peptide receptor variant I-like n=1 Tax=Neodiprion lecontei TaxID=441921 RepID=A0ABM3G0W7_NEOLC|nr:adipokinetic hormone/corazonin-related peptide receptor variant I-like [Neodiprion lecontei]